MTIELPLVDRRGLCHILVAAVGGQGANKAAKILFDLAVEELGLGGGYDARYGSEKKGTATDVSLRIGNEDADLAVSGPTNRPHMLVAFHDWLIVPQGLHRGLQTDARVIVNTTLSGEDLRPMLELHSGHIVTLDASAIALDTGARLNIPMLAALALELGFPMDLLLQRIESTWPHAADVNRAAFEAVAKACNRFSVADDLYPLTDPVIARGPLGYLNMLNGGGVNARYHSTVHRQVRLAGHGLTPEFHGEHCTGCALCLTTCSDPGGILWDGSKVVGIDPEYCKGCMRCVTVCPATKKGHALEMPEEFQNVS